MNDRFPIGTAMTREWRVEEKMTVGSHGSVNLPVLATPQLIFMLEDTCVFAIEKLLVDGEATVGTSVHVDHLAASRVGDCIDAFAELVSVRGKRLIFRLEARTGKVVVARGLHERAVVDARKFEASLK